MEALSEKEAYDRQRQSERFLISSLKIGKLKAVTHLDIRFEPDVTIIAGENGVGKTTILSTIATHLDELPDPERDYPPWNEDRKPNPAGVSLKVIGRHRLVLPNPEGSGQGPTIVKFLFYPQERAHRYENSEASDYEVRGVVRSFQTWWTAQDIDEARKVRDLKDLSYRDPELLSFERAIQQTAAFKGARFSAESRLTVTRNGSSVSWDQLSSGERAVFTLVGDLARRSASLIKINKPNINFVVAIDEVELHLHPKWQRQIVPILREAFPDFQFIITTHSPQVIGSVDARCVRLLSKTADGMTKVRTPSATKGVDSNSILEALMGAEERDSDAADKINRFLKLLSQKRWTEAEVELEEIGQFLEDPSSIVPSLKVQLELAIRRNSK